MPKDKKIKELQKKVAENLAGWQKALADYQNLQKETDKRLSDLAQFTLADNVLQLLPIFDNYQTAVDHVPAKHKKESWAVGLEHILKLWETFLQDNNIERIKTVGKEFDPYVHESVGQVSEDDKKDHIIIEEKQSGYILNKSVIRSAKVIINNLERK